MNDSKPSIILVEDNESIYRLIEYKLLRSGYEFKHFSHGVKGLEAIIKYKPDLAILDVMLPGITGFDILRQIRENEQVKETKIIMLTSKNREEDLQIGFGYKVEEYMSKPFKVGELLMRIQRVLR